MKRDLDLIRTLLIQIEDREEYENPLSSHDINIEGYSIDQINYHLDLLNDAGMIEGWSDPDSSGTTWFVQRLTWNAHEFLDAARNDNIWKKTKEKIKQIGSSVSFDIVKQIAVDYAKDLYLGQ